MPEDVELTSFSILFARYKGQLEQMVRGAAALDHLKDGDTVLISEGCTHHRQCEDIGTAKLPAWINGYTRKQNLQFHFTSGGEFPEDFDGIALAVHCGGCMLNEREMQSRVERAAVAVCHDQLRRGHRPDARHPAPLAVALPGTGQIVECIGGRRKSAPSVGQDRIIVIYCIFSVYSLDRGPRLCYHNPIPKRAKVLCAGPFARFLVFR